LQNSTTVTTKEISLFAHSAAAITGSPHLGGMRDDAARCLPIFLNSDEKQPFNQNQFYRSIVNYFFNMLQHIYSRVNPAY